MSEREMVESEAAGAADWQAWAMECLTDEQVSHCGHLDTKIIVGGCTYCGEIVAHGSHDGSQWRTCEMCRPPSKCRVCLGVGEHSRFCWLTPVVSGDTPNKTGSEE